jgi:hypothetical protein
MQYIYFLTVVFVTLIFLPLFGIVVTRLTENDKDIHN